MHAALLALFLPTFMAFGPVAQAPATPRALLMALMKADNASDLEAVIKFYAADATLLPPNENIVSGKDAVRQRYQGMFGRTRMSVEFVVDEEQSSQDLAFIRGRTVGSRRSKDGQSTEDLTNKFVMVLKRESGEWRIASLIWNANK